MNNDTKNRWMHKRMVRRGFLLLGAQAAGVGLLASRAHHLQIEQNEHYYLLAEDNRINTQIFPAPRGTIFDERGRLIAGNTPNFRVEANTEQLIDPEAMIAELSQIIKITDTEKSSFFRAINEAPRGHNILLKDELTWQEFSIIGENLPLLPGIQTSIVLARFYPFHEYLAHSIGYVGQVTERDFAAMEQVHPIYHYPKMIIGKTGIEREYEVPLRGIEGKRTIEQNAKGRIMREIDRQNGIQGETIQMSIDAAFQLFAMKRMENESGAAVVIDIETGQVKLMASTPSFNPNLFVGGISHKDFDPLNNNIRRPMYNKAAQGTYPPGSTFKMVTALAALEAGTISPSERVHCAGKIRNGRDFHCWKRGGHGGVDLKYSLKQSCDIYYYTIAERTGINRIAETAHKLGLGEIYDIPHANMGLIPTIEWKGQKYDQPWVPGDTYNAGIGQGYVLTTPLQLAVMTARIASNRAVLPSLIKTVDGKVTTPSFEPLGFDEQNLALVREGMFAVVNESGGTAGRSRFDDKGATMAGKTGTAQVRNISAAERSSGVLRNDELEWQSRDHALFVAFAPYDNPKYALAVVVEHGGSGSAAAAPIARDLMLYALNGQRPPLEAYPASERAAAEEFMANLPAVNDILYNPEDPNSLKTPEPKNSDDDNQSGMA